MQCAEAYITRIRFISALPASWVPLIRGQSTKRILAFIAGRSAGAFAFEGVKPGEYWLSGKRNLSRFKLAINYDPNSHTDGCSSLFYEVRDGELKLRRMITLY